MKCKDIADELLEKNVRITVGDLYQKLVDWGLMKRDNRRPAKESKNRPCVDGITLSVDEKGYEYPEFSRDVANTIIRKLSGSPSNRTLTNDEIVTIIDSSDLILPTSVSHSLKWHRASFRNAYGTSIHQYYLGSARWARKKERVFEHYGKKCYRCMLETGIEVHHLTYENWLDELVIELIPLCNECHGWIHRAWNDDPIRTPFVKHMSKALEDLKKEILISTVNEDPDFLNALNSLKS